MLDPETYVDGVKLTIVPKATVPVTASPTLPSLTLNPASPQINVGIPVAVSVHNIILPALV